MRKPTFCICENKDTDQLGGNRKADEGHCFHYRNTVVQFFYLLNPKFLASSCAAVWFVSDLVGNHNVGLLMSRLIYLCFFQLIAVMSYIHAKNVSGQPSIVICPLSVLRNWQEEIKR